MYWIFAFFIVFTVRAEQVIILNGSEYRVESVTMKNGVPHIKTNGPKKLCTPVNLNLFQGLMKKSAQRTYHIKKKEKTQPKRTYHIKRTPAESDKKSHRPPEEPSYQ